MTSSVHLETEFNTRIIGPEGEGPLFIEGIHPLPIGTSIRWGADLLQVVAIDLNVQGFELTVSTRRADVAR